MPYQVAGYGARLFTTSVRYAMCNAATSMHLFATAALAVNTPRCAMSWRFRRLHIQSSHHDWRSGLSPVRSWKAFRTRSPSKDQVTSTLSDMSIRARTLLLWSFAVSISLSSTNSVAHSPAADAMMMAIACCPADESERASASNWSHFDPNRARGVFLWISAIASCTSCSRLPPVTEVPRGDPGGRGFTFADSFLGRPAMAV